MFIFITVTIFYYTFFLITEKEISNRFKYDGNLNFGYIIKHELKKAVYVILILLLYLKLNHLFRPLQRNLRSILSYSPNNLHEDPDVPNYGKPNTGPILKEGMTIAVEPMINLGTDEVYLASDDWTVITQDNMPSAHFEHTILVTKDGYEILTGDDNFE